MQIIFFLNNSLEAISTITSAGIVSLDRSFAAFRIELSQLVSGGEKGHLR